MPVWKREEIQKVLRFVSLRMRKFECVVFDLGGVLIDWNPRYLYRKLIPDENEVEYFLTHICHSAWNERQDAGRPFAEGIAELVAVYPQHERLIRAYFERWPEMIAGAFDGSVEILKMLHQRGTHRLFALSNWSHETFPYARARFEFFDCFEAILLSGNEKLIKPDPRFFRLLSERHGVDPRKSIFIDDVEKNVNAAKDLGFEAIRFTDPQTLLSRLRALSVL